MSDQYYTVEQISDMLEMHPKTIQRYIREGRLRAVKIGKGWRVTGHDLSAFTESAQAQNSIKQPGSGIRMTVTASAVIDITAAGKADAIRIMNTLTAVLNSKPPEYGRSSMQTQFIEGENLVRVTLWGDARFMAAMMENIAALTENIMEE